MTRSSVDLPRAVRADERDDPAVRDGEVDAVEDRQACRRRVTGKANRQVGQTDRAARRRPRSRQRPRERTEDRRDRRIQCRCRPRTARS